MSQSNRKLLKYAKEPHGGAAATARFGVTQLCETSPAQTASQSTRAL